MSDRVVIVLQLAACIRCHYASVGFASSSFYTNSDTVCMHGRREGVQTEKENVFSLYLTKVDNYLEESIHQ